MSEYAVTPWPSPLPLCRQETRFESAATGWEGRLTRMRRAVSRRTSPNCTFRRKPEAKSDLIVIWGTNAVNTQVNVMTHATRARIHNRSGWVSYDGVVDWEGAYSQNREVSPARYFG